MVSSKKRHVIAIGIGGVLALFAGAWYIGRKPTAPHILIITLDTTRADRLGCYGYTGARTPAIDAIAASGVLVEHAFTPVPITLPAHATIMTSKLPPEHGIRVNGENGLAKGVPVLAQVLRERGYRTGAFVSASVLHRIFGLDRGFDVYDDQVSKHGGGPDEAIRERNADAVVDSALAWLDKQAADPFFCWVHLFDPHFPYEPPASHQKPGEHPYDGEIAFADSQVGRLTAWLDARGLRDRTLIVVTADHGESLGEHGEQTHAFLVHDATMRVPLVFSMPGILDVGNRVEGPAGLVDVMPTVLDLAGVPGPPQMSGRTIRAQLGGANVGDHSYYGEAHAGHHEFGWRPLRSLTTNQWKLIDGPAPELYDRRNDPGELTDLAGVNRRVLDRMEQSLATAMHEMKTQSGKAVQIPESLRRQIESLGYGAGAGTTTPQDSPPLPNPRDMMPVFGRYCEARSMLMGGDLAEGISLMARVAKETPGSLIVHCELSTAYSRAGQYDKALAAATNALNLAPSNPNVLYALGVAAAGRRAFEEAASHFRRAVELRPSFTFSRNNLALSLVELGRENEAIEHYHESLRLDPDRADTHYNLGQAWIRLDRNPQAIAALERCVQLEPDRVQAIYQLGGLLLGEARYADAIQRFEHGMTLAPDFAGFRNGLAWIMATCPRTELRDGAKAVSLAEATWQTSPRTDPGLLDTLAVAYAEAGRMDDATTAAKKALSLLGPEARPGKREEIAGHLENFKNGRPVRDRPRGLE